MSLTHCTLHCSQLIAVPSKLAGVPAEKTKEGIWANRASLALQQPLQDDSRQHSWTAGRPTPKYHGPSHMVPRSAIPRTSPGLPVLAPLIEDSTYNQTSNLHQIGAADEADLQAAMQHPSTTGRRSEQTTGPVYTSYPPLSEPPTHAQTSHQRPVTGADGFQDAPGAFSAMPFSPGPSPEAQQGHMLRDSPPRAVSPFESIAEMPFTPPQRAQSILTTQHSDRVHFEENPLFVPLDSPDGAGYRYASHPGWPSHALSKKHMLCWNLLLMCITTSSVLIPFKNTVSVCTDQHPYACMQGVYPVR